MTRSHLSHLPRLLPLLAVFSLASCATLTVEQGPPFMLSDDPAVMGTEIIPLDRFLVFAESKNPSYGRQSWTVIWRAYREACQVEGVNQAVALVQMLHETNFLKFGGTVQARQNNFAGLGTVDKNTPGLSFPDVQTGALAHVQHLKAYGSTEPLKSTLIDPRFRYVKRGVAPTMKALTGKWAADPLYGEKLMKYYRTLGG